MSTQDDKSEDNDKRDELIFDLVKRRLDGESTRLSNLDSKATNLIGFISVVVGLLLGGSAFAPAGISNQALSVPYFVGISLLITSIILALLATKVMKWIAIPDVEYLRQEYTKLAYGEVLRRNAGEMINAVMDAEKKNNKKAQLIGWSWYCLVGGLIIVLASIVFPAVFGIMAPNMVPQDNLK
jgi:Na+/phosphate symporter